MRNLSSPTACLPSLRPLLSFISTASPERLDLGNTASGLSKGRPTFANNNSNITSVRTSNDQSFTTDGDQNRLFAQVLKTEKSEMNYARASLNSKKCVDTALEEGQYPGKNGGIMVQMDFDIQYT